MNEMTGRVLKFMAIIAFIIVFLVGIVPFISMAVAIITFDGWPQTGSIAGNSFAASATAVFSYMGCLVLCVILYAFGEIIEKKINN